MIEPLRLSMLMMKVWGYVYAHQYPINFPFFKIIFFYIKETTVGFEQSELLLFKNVMLEEKGELTVALDHLDASRKMIVDELALKERKAQLLLSLEKFQEAEAAYRDLVDYNPDNILYYKAIEKCLKLSRGTYTPLIWKILMKFWPWSVDLCRWPRGSDCYQRNVQGLFIENA